MGVLDYNKLSKKTKKHLKFLLIIFALLGLLYFFNILSFHEIPICLLILVVYWILMMLLKLKEFNKLIAKKNIELKLTNNLFEKALNTDTLTGLYNRSYFNNYLDALICSNGNNPFALLLIDVNRFKSINNFYSHEIGDKILIALSNRLLESPLSDYKTFRLGDNEFAVIIENYTDKSEIEFIAETIFNTLQIPVIVSPHTFTINVSIGIALCPDDTFDKKILIQYADIALLEAQISQAKKGYLFFDKFFAEKINRNHEIQFLLQSADYDKEFMLYYQPLYKIENQSFIGMEALIRWNNPEKGFIPPSEFIPIAEQMGIISKIDKWVIHTAFCQIKQWNELYNSNLKMSINISPISIQQKDFVDWFIEKIKRINVNPYWINLEITERIAIDSTISNIELFKLLDANGIEISIDDFGTGYSSLRYIKDFHVDYLKIAKELIDDIAVHENAFLIIQTIIMMAKMLKLKVIAEGVQDINQLKILKESGCDEVQGYILGKPVPSEEFERQHIKTNLSNCTPPKKFLD